MGGLDEFALAQRTDRAAVPVGAQHVLAEALLMEPDPHLAEGIRSSIGRGDRSAGLGVHKWYADLQDHPTLLRQVPGDEDRGNDHVLARRDAVEVDERALELMGGAQRAVVRLVGSAGAVVVDDRAVGLEDVVVGPRLPRFRRSRDQRERGGPGHLAWTMDAALKRAEADLLAPEHETAAQRSHGHQVVVRAAELGGSRDRGLAQR